MPTEEEIKGDIELKKATIISVYEAFLKRLVALEADLHTDDTNVHE